MMFVRPDKVDTLEFVNEDHPAGDHNSSQEAAVERMIDLINARISADMLERNFRSLSILGLTSMVVDTWVGLLSSCSFSFINGGRGGSIWAFLVVWIANIAVTASMAEMASIAPTSAGQYHWVSEFAPASIQRGLSYITGWISALSWQSFLATPIFFASELILTLASMTHPNFIPKPWHSTLLTLFLASLITLLNLLLTAHLHRLEYAILFLFILGYFSILIPLWTPLGGPPKVSASEALTTFENYGGWASPAAATYVGQITAAGCLVCTDSAAHMAEEVRDASISVPRAMMGTIVINGAMGFGMIVTLAFVVQDLKGQVVESEAVSPFIEIFERAVGSRAGAVGMTAPIVVLAVCNSVNAMAAASRQAWAFGRDEGLPFSGWFGRVKVVGGAPVPVNAMLASLSICFVITLLNLGGSEVFDSVYGLGAGAACLTYLLSIGSVLWRRTFGDPLPHARWSMGRAGVPVNLVAVLYLSQFFVVSFFPVFRKVTAQSMNWGIAMFGGVTIICTINYFINGRKSFNGPKTHVSKDM